MLVMAFVADVISGIVQKRGIGQRLTIFARATQSFAEARRTAAGARRCTWLECGCSTWHRSANSPTERARAFAWISNRWRNARCFEKQTFTDTVSRDENLARFDAPKNFRRHRDSSNDDVRSLWIESLQSATLVRRHTGERV